MLLHTQENVASVSFRTKYKIVLFAVVKGGKKKKISESG